MTRASRSLQAEYQRRYVARQLEERPEEYRARLNEQKKAWAARNPEKRYAHGCVARAVRFGKLRRPSECERCGKACKPEASHADYSRPLDVEWLCRQCHAAKDRRAA